MWDQPKIWYHLIMPNLNYFILLNRELTLTEFGFIASVHDLEGWIKIVNKDGDELHMKKTYHRWPKVLEKCRNMMIKDFKVVTRYCSSLAHQKYFNEIYIDPPNAPLLGHPLDGSEAPVTLEQLVMERVWKQEVLAEDMSNSSDLQAERERFLESLKNQSDRDKFLTSRTTSFLNSRYLTFSKKKAVYLYIDEHTRRRAALRLGIDLTGYSTLKVILEGHLYNTNFIHVILPEFESIDCIIGLHRKEDGNEWISTINNGDTGWWIHEKNIALHKDIDKPIKHYLELFYQIQISRHDLSKQKEKNHLGHQTVIKFPKKYEI